MNVLWIPNFCPFPATNGGKVVIKNRMKQVSKFHKVYMIAESDVINEDIQKEAELVCSDYYLVHVQKKSMFFLLKHFLVEPFNVGRLINQKLTDAIIEFLIKYSIDLINIDLPMMYINLIPIKDRIRNIPIIINQHNLEYENIKSKLKVKNISFLMKVYASIEYRKLFRWEKNVYEKETISGYTFVSIDEKEAFKRNFTVSEENILLSPIGTSEPVLEERKGEHTFNVVFPAAFDYPPNVHGALWFVNEVWSSVTKSVKDARLYLVGRNPVEEIKELSCDSIVVTGTVESIASYMKIADMFIVPIFYGGGVKTKLIEMGCWNKPVISSSNGIVGTLYKNGMDIVVQDESGDFAEACIDILLHSDKYTSMKQSMLEKTKQNYLWDDIGVKYNEFIEKIASMNLRGRNENRHN